MSKCLPCNQTNRSIQSTNILSKNRCKDNECLLLGILFFCENAFFPCANDYVDNWPFVSSATNPGNVLDVSLRDVLVGVDAAVAQERPPASYLFAVGDVDLDNDALLFGV